MKNLPAALAALMMISWTQLSAATHDSAAFEGEIKAFERRDQTNPPAEGAIVFVGSSSIRMWTNLPAVFPGRVVLNRGFGGAYAADVNFYFERVVGKYHPSRIVYYAGDNDIAGGVKPEKVLEDFRDFTRKVADRVGPVPVAFIAIKPSPSRVSWMPQQREANRLIRDFIATQSNITYLDVWPGMTDEKGVPHEELFLADKLHMSGAGYAIWREIVQKWLASKDASVSKTISK
ncbi:MAG TPA: GDSL-type esterase/lipase family protein [Candidatus Limnocylindria bacterium]|nr:GDSL-type esterase/lipase family protein [Candidatus Limnocylindria bacterium]